MNYAFYTSGASERVYKYINQASTEVLQKIKLVITDASVTSVFANMLSKNKIDLKEFPYNNIKDNSKSRNLKLSNYILKQLKEHKIDYCFSFGSHLLEGLLLKEYQFRLINFHPAILPMFPGIKAIDQATSHGNVLLVGNTAHFIDEEIDHGKIIMQSVIPLKAFEDSGDYNIILDFQIEMLNQLIYILENNMLVFENGKPIILGANYTKGSIFPKIK